MDIALTKLMGAIPTLSTLVVGFAKLNGVYICNLVSKLSKINDSAPFDSEILHWFFASLKAQVLGIFANEF